MDTTAPSLEAAVGLPPGSFDAHMQKQDQAVELPRGVVVAGPGPSVLRDPTSDGVILSDPPRRPRRPSFALSALSAAMAMSYYPPGGGPPMLPRLQLDAEPPPSKTKHDIARLAKAREKRIAQVQKLAARRNCSLLEVVEGDKHMHDLQHIPDWALQHGVQVRWIDETGVRAPEAVQPAEGPGGQPSAEDKVDPDFV